MAQDRFVHLTNNEMRLDSIAPAVGYTIPLPTNYTDSVYTVEVVYPEYAAALTASERTLLESWDLGDLPAIPTADYRIVFDKKRPQLRIHVLPLATKAGQVVWLEGFMIRIKAEARATAADHFVTTTKSTTLKSPRATAVTRDDTGIYAVSSNLASGTWAKIRVSESGVYQLTSSLVQNAGFTDLSRVHVYGYGGNLQPEAIYSDYLFATDDLQEVEQFISSTGEHYFYGEGPVSWSTPTTAIRTRNYFSDYGYYFITEESEAVVSAWDSWDEFVFSFYPTNADYHSLYEVDGYAWYEGGRNLYDPTTIAAGSSKSYTFINTTESDQGKVLVVMSAAEETTVRISLNGTTLGTSSLAIASSYDKAKILSKTYTVYNFEEENTVTLEVTAGGPLRLDYISLTYIDPAPEPLAANALTPEFIGLVDNQDLHGDPQADMVIIIPSSGKLLEQAQRLADFHVEHDGLRVNIVRADQLFNEFSSGTPDANAYRRYLKMLYDRACDTGDAPKHLLLFGDCVWDNRMVSTATKAFNADDYLLCTESDNSYSAISCYTDDGFFCLLDEGEGADPQTSDLLDLGVGRFPVTTAAQAKIMVDKSISYAENANAGAWQNVVLFLGDDGNENVHMESANDIADEVIELYPALTVRKIMWDSYTRESSSTGATYPEITTLIKEQQAEGALFFDYCGHGSETQISHEKVLFVSDFKNFTNDNLPLWITASCDIMPYDGVQETIGEEAVLNANGGAMAFYGTARTVYTNYNKRINDVFVKYVLERDDDGLPHTLGEAQRLAKNYLITSGTELTTNKLQYSLLGDPALRLNIPEQERIVVDAINGAAVGDTLIALRAGAVVTIEGHVVGANDFSGTLTAIVHDSEETVTCRRNSTSAASTAFTYQDRTKTLFTGEQSVSDGQFAISFAVPLDINYSNDTGLITLFAVTDDKSMTVNGYSEAITIGGTESSTGDGVGPTLYCYLNDDEFIDGGNVNATPYFYAIVSDDDGLNTAGISVGHDMTLIVDDSASMTYNVNDYFTYDFGSYTSGTLGYSLPELEQGPHTLTFRAWDIFNNSSTTTLTFNVVRTLKPSIASVSCAPNPAQNSTTFIVAHDRLGSDISVIIDIFDSAGRHLYSHEDTNVNSSSAYTYTWDLTCSNGSSLQTGVYIVRARIAADGTQYASKSSKLIVIK